MNIKIDSAQLASVIHWITSALDSHADGLSEDTVEHLKWKRQKVRELICFLSKAQNENKSVDVYTLGGMLSELEFVKPDAFRGIEFDLEVSL